MALTSAEVVEQARELLDIRGNEMPRLERIREYLRDDDDNRRLQGLPAAAPVEVQRLARVARVNMIKYVVNARVQGFYVDGFRTPRSSDDAPAWRAWQRNKMDARQIGINRAALSYGAAYMTVLPGEPTPVMRGVSPRDMTAVYGDDDDWPAFALERRRGGVFRLIDDEAVHRLVVGDDSPTGVTLIRSDMHGAQIDGRPVCPVIRFRETEDLDDPVVGLVEPLTTLQDQINVTTFGLLVAQHYGAFRQRYVIGWLAETESELLRVSAQRLLSFEDSPSELQVGEFGQTDLKGYLDSREASLRHMATVSQTAAHELLGQLVNLSADALAAAEKSHQRAVVENRTVLGEGYEQALNLAGQLMGEPADDIAEVVWRDTESRSLAQVADALGKLVQMLGVPPEELWEKIPGTTQQEIERWRARAAEGDSLANLSAILDRQAAEAVPSGGPDF